MTEFKAVPKRWIVEPTFAGLDQYHRWSKDSKCLVNWSGNMIYITMYNSCWGNLLSTQLRASKPPLRKYGLNNSWFLILIFKRKPTCVYSPSKLNRTLFARCSWLSFLQLKRISPSIKKCIGFKIFFPTRGISFRISSLSFDTFGKDSILTLFLTFD